MHVLGLFILYFILTITCFGWSIVKSYQIDMGFGYTIQKEI